MLLDSVDHGCWDYFVGSCGYLTLNVYFDVRLGGSLTLVDLGGACRAGGKSHRVRSGHAEGALPPIPVGALSV